MRPLVGEKRIKKTNVFYIQFFPDENAENDSKKRVLQISEVDKKKVPLIYPAARATAGRRLSIQYNINPL